MSSKALLENMRDTTGCYRPDVLDKLWSALPEQLRTVALYSTELTPQDRAAFILSRDSRTFRLGFHTLPAPMDRELAWCCWRLIDLGGRVPVGAVQSLIRWLAAAAEDRPDLRGSLMVHPPREWEKVLTTTYARRRGVLPGSIWIRNITALLRRCYQPLWTAYDQRPWWQREVWNLALDPRIPRRLHEPVARASIYFHKVEPVWLRAAMQWWFKIALETGELTWTSLRAHRAGLQPFADWLARQDPRPPWLCDDPTDVRVLMLEFRTHLHSVTARAGVNIGQPLSALRINDILTSVEKFYTFLHDHRETAARALAEPGWLRLGPHHAVLYRHGEKGRPVVQPERHDVIDAAALSQITANLHLLGAPVEDGGLGDEQAMRIMMLLARTGRRVNEICMLDRDPLLPLTHTTTTAATEPADEAFAAKLRYQQTKIAQAPDTMLVDAEIVAIITEQQRWVDERLAPGWAVGVAPKYLFLGRKLNRNANRSYPLERVHTIVGELAQRLDIRDGAGRLVDFNRTHRFRHTKATSLLNAGVPLHVVQRYMGHLSPTMTMEYAETLTETHEREFLRYRKITADAREVPVNPRDLYDMLELDKRTDRILPNGWCLLPPRQVCAKGNACLTCDKFATDATFLPELAAQHARTEQLVDDRLAAFRARTGHEMSPDNIWLTGRRQERDALGRIMLTLEQTPTAGGTAPAIRGAGVDARVETILHTRDGG